MRTLTALLFIFASAFSIGHHNNWWESVDEMQVASIEKSVDDRDFVSPADEGFRHELNDIRAVECTGYQYVLREIGNRFAKRTEQQVAAAENDYAYILAIQVMTEAVEDGIMHYTCMPMVFNSEVSETNKFVLMTPEGDYVIGYEWSDDWRNGSAYTPWSQVDHAGWGFDTIAFTDFTDGEVYEGMREFPLTKK